MQIQSVEDIFIHLLSDTYSAEKQLTRALSKLSRSAYSDKLTAAFQSHLDETHGQIAVSYTHLTLPTNSRV